MPKKPARNAFYYYMLDFKEEQRQKGIHFANMKEIADAANPSWREQPNSVRMKYEAKAKAEKQKRNVPDMKYTSTGISFEEIERQAREARDAESNERKDVKNIIALKHMNNMLLEENFFLMDVNYFCAVQGQYLYGEATILRFNLKDGLKDYYHEIINPGRIPQGFFSDVKIGCAAHGLIMPDETNNPTNYMQLLANLIDYLKQQDRTMKVLPPIFTLPEKVLPVQQYIQQLCAVADEEESLFRVYKLDFMFFTLINKLRRNDNEGFPKESLSLVQLKKDTYMYSRGLACAHHSAIDMPAECSLSRVRRWAFTMLDACCPLANIEVKAGCHLPKNYDIEGIQAILENSRLDEASNSRNAGIQAILENSRLDEASNSRNARGPSSIVSQAGSSVQDESKKEKRAHVPLRMPRTLGRNPPGSFNALQKQ